MGQARAISFTPASVGRFHEFALLGMMASGMAALLGAGGLDSTPLDAALLALVGVALAVRTGLVWRNRTLAVSATVLNLLTVAYVLFYGADYYWISNDLGNATVHLVCFVAVVKLLTARRPRDYFFLKIIAFLELLAASILSANLNFFIALVFFLGFTAATLASAEIVTASTSRLVISRGSGPFARRLVWLTSLATLGVLLLTGALFFALPRTAKALLDRLVPGSNRVAGFSNEVTLGQVGDIRRQATTVMHIRFGDGLRPPDLKWRGSALAEFDGWKWYNSPQAGRPRRVQEGLLKLADDDELRHPERRVTYEVVLHGGLSDWLFIGGRAEYLRVPSSLVVETPTDSYRVPLAEPDGFRYVVHAALPDALNRGLTVRPLEAGERNFLLRLPPVDVRVIELARSLTAHAHSDAERATVIEQYLREHYQYSLASLDHEVEDPLATFLFERKKGHCEYFASAMAVMLRAVWVPSRVATGFQSGSYNELSGWQVVRASDAHSWVEAYLQGRGWTAFDPTPPDSTAGAASPFSRLGLWLDAAEMFWQEWVLGYDLDRQLSLAFRVEQSRRSFGLGWIQRTWSRVAAATRQARQQPAGRLAAAAAALSALLLAAWFWPRLHLRVAERARLERLKQGRPASSDAELAYRQMLAQLRRRGLQKPPSSTPAEFARSLAGLPVGALVGEFTEVYNHLRFGGQRLESARLAELLAAIEATG